MRLTTRGRYGLRAMVELACYYGQGPLFMSAISASQGIPRKYLHSLLTTLRGAGFVHSLRGSQGGYSLARAPAEITAADVVIALEGPMVLVDCEERGARCERYDVCPTRQLWEELGAMIEERLRTVSLADLVREQADLVRKQADQTENQPERGGR
ncbi:MAG: Rrf2 family transcriptional regulator [Candidatus Eisenbacteria bacterium]|nr:Rrf2 family transcriptional regulator [Candidatus Eisenbacteria bacterium]